MENIYYVSFFKQLVDSNGHPAPPAKEPSKFVQLTIIAQSNSPGKDLLS